MHFGCHDWQRGAVSSCRGGRGCCWASCKTSSPKSHLALRWRTHAQRKSRLSWLWKLINQGCVNSPVHLILTNTTLSMYTFSFSNSFPLFCNICSWCEGRESTLFFWVILAFYFGHSMCWYIFTGTPVATGLFLHQHQKSCCFIYFF